LGSPTDYLTDDLADIVENGPALRREFAKGPARLEALRAALASLYVDYHRLGSGRTVDPSRVLEVLNRDRYSRDALVEAMRT
jgi:hypothetical protein